MHLFVKHIQYENLLFIFILIQDQHCTVLNAKFYFIALVEYLTVFDDIYGTISFTKISF